MRYAMRYAVAIVMLLSPCLASAASTYCKLTGDDFSMLKSVSWDDSTGMAKMQDSLGKSHNGIITDIREHNKGTKKVNLLFKFEKPDFGSDEAEYIVFPVDKTFRVIGVRYVIRSGTRLLNTHDGNNKADCITLE